jgi:hypothetical protein
MSQRGVGRGAGADCSGNEGSEHEAYFHGFDVFLSLNY